MIRIGQSQGLSGETGSLLQDYTNRFGGAVSRRQSNVALRAAKIEAELAYRARGNFLAHMNHELRTPLNAIVGFTTMLKEAKTYNFSEEQTSEYLDYILQSAELLLGHIDTLLELAAAESGGAKMQPQAYKLDDLLNEVVETTLPIAQEVGVNLVTNIATDLPDVFIDPDKILKALEHLLENALSNCDNDDQISLIAKSGYDTSKTGQERREWVYVAIEDTGAGMTPEELNRALRVFEQIHTGLDRKFMSAGIGLPIAKSFIELNNGRFNVKSQKGVGTTVRFALPVKVASISDDLDAPESTIAFAGDSLEDLTPSAWRKAS